MDRMKTFFKYFLIFIIFFIASNILVFVIPNTRYKSITCNIKESYVTGTAKATSINGIAKIRVENQQEEVLKSKYLKIECYTKRDVLMGIKYIEIGELESHQSRDFEVHFNYSKVARTEVSVVEEVGTEIPVEDRISDPYMSLGMMLASIIVLYAIL